MGLDSERSLMTDGVKAAERSCFGFGFDGGGRRASGKGPRLTDWGLKCKDWGREGSGRRSLKSAPGSPAILILSVALLHYSRQTSSGTAVSLVRGLLCCSMAVLSPQIDSAISTVIINTSVVPLVVSAGIGLIRKRVNTITSMRISGRTIR